MLLNPKLSKLFRVGALVYNIDGSRYRCTAKLATADGYTYRLANLQGIPVSTPLGFYPVNSGLVRFAAWMRLKVAFNSDFDLYVKEYIRAAGLPVDPTMNWAKFFQAKIAPKLMSRDPEIQDEAIHNLIIKLLAERKILDPKNPKGFANAIKNFKPETQALPLDKQVRAFLVSSFLFNISKANDYIKRVVFQHQYHDEESGEDVGVRSMWGDSMEDDGDINLLDTEEHASGMNSRLIDADIDVDKFRHGFSDYLHNRYRENVAEQYLSLFDLIYEELRNNRSVPKPRDIREHWVQDTGESEIKFKNMLSSLPKVIAKYVGSLSRSNSYTVPDFVEVMLRAGNRSVLEPVHASIKLAEDFPINHNISSPSESGSGSTEDTPIDLGEVAEEAEPLEELAPLALAASVQWEAPSCSACAVSSDDVKECPACSGNYCSQCVIDHHANNPSHERLASKTASMNAEEVSEIVHRGDYEVGHKPRQGRCDVCRDKTQIFDGHTNTPPIVKFTICSHCLNVNTAWGN